MFREVLISSSHWALSPHRTVTILHAAPPAILVLPWAIRLAISNLSAVSSPHLYYLAVCSPFGLSVSFSPISMKWVCPFVNSLSFD